MTAVHALAILKAAALPISVFGVLLVVAGVKYDLQTSPRIKVMFACLVVALVAGIWSASVCAQDVVCTCNACKDVEPYSWLWYFLGCWA